YMREAQKVERIWSLAVCRLCLGGKASKEQQPRLVVGQCQVEPRDPLPQISVEILRVPLVLETRHKIVSEPSQVRLTPQPPPHLLLEPEVEHKVQVYVGQDGAERAALRGSRFRSDDAAVLHDAGPEPFANQAQENAVCNAMRHHPPQPLMIDMVEGPYDTLPVISTSQRRSLLSALAILSKASRSTCLGLCIGKVGSCLFWSCPMAVNLWFPPT